MEDNYSTSLHVVMFPWLAMGHLIPFFKLSKFLATNGHRISFASTPRNLQRLPTVPPKLSPLITFLPLRLPPLLNLPAEAESSTDVPFHKQPLLKKAFDMLKPQLAAFLEASKPDWIIYDYASYWLPLIARDLGVSGCFFSLFTAAFLAFLGPPAMLAAGGDERSAAVHFTVVPKWIPFESKVVYRLHEMRKHEDSLSENESGTPDIVRFGVAGGESDLVAVRSCVVFEPEWFGLLGQIYQKPVVPIGFLPPLMEDDEEEDDKWLAIKEWLDQHRVNSVIYVAFGTEATLSIEELQRLAIGLDQSGLPFFWVLRNRPDSTQSELEMLPDGFEEQVRGRGAVHFGWAPQVRILSHDSVGGFLTHCGWNSIIEGLGLGRVLMLFPVMNDQGLNARVLTGKNLGVEIPRDERDGSITSDSVSETVRLAMVGDSGEPMRAKAKEMKSLFGDRKKNEHMMNAFLQHLQEKRRNALVRD